MSVLIDIPTNSASKGFRDVVSVSKLKNFLFKTNFSNKLIIASLFTHRYSPLILGNIVSCLSSFVGILFIKDISSSSVRFSTTSFFSKSQNSDSAISRFKGAFVFIVANILDWYAFSLY